jgi:hypothetical protein
MNEFKNKHIFQSANDIFLKFSTIIDGNIKMYFIHNKGFGLLPVILYLLFYINMCVVVVLVFAMEG